MSYNIKIHKQALKELEEIPKKGCSKIITAIDSLADEPRPIGCKKLKGEHDYIWRIRVGNFRVLYKIDDEIMIVEIGKIGHRKNIYD